VPTSLAELAEDTVVHLLPRPGFELVERKGFVYEAGTVHATVQRIRLGDVENAVRLTRAESRRRGHRFVEWWVGWSATPGDLAERLLALGLVPDDVPRLTGMTCATEPAAVPGIDVRRVGTLDEQLEALEVDWNVWRLGDEERAERRDWERARFAETHAAGVVHHFAAYLDGRAVGFGRAIDMGDAVALMGGAVLPEARGRGVYRALVHARWRHAANRGTPLLVVQAGDLSGPVLSGLGFRPHGELSLFVDRLQQA
jgi:GNAT superfamily N-acetyltransferase